MSTRGKLILLVLLAFVTLSVSSCLVRRDDYRKWHLKRNQRYHKYGGRHGYGGRHLWVRDRFKNTH